VLYGPSIDEFASGAATTSNDGGSLLDQQNGSSSSSSASSSSSGGDASRLADGAPLPFSCPPNALICDDFERANVGGVFLKSNGPVTISAAQSHSPSRSLSAIVKNQTPMPYVESTIQGGPARVTASFWFYAAAAPPAYRARIAHLWYGPGCDWDLTWQLALDNEGVKMSTETYNDDVNPSCGPVDGKGHNPLSQTQVYVPRWHHVTLKVDVTKQLRHVETQIDDLPPIIDDISSARSSVPTQLTLGVGILCVQTSGGCFEWDRADYPIFIDDVILAPTP
jgi:hypothetical protein